MHNLLRGSFSFVLLQSMLHPSSDQAVRITRLFNYFNIAAAGMFLLVTLLTLYICLKFRKKDDALPRQTKGNNKLELLMIAVPALLLSFFFYQTVNVMRAVNPAPGPIVQPDVIITGHQFWWEVTYPAAKFTTANEVHLPAGKNLLLELRSADVIHDWWVPALGNKMDLVPGKINHLWVNIHAPATYAGLCSEFCGAQHAWMRLDVIADNEKDYNAWLAASALGAQQPADSVATHGAALFQVSTCANCHRISGTMATGRVGPDLTHLFSRKKMLAGMMPLTEANLYQWISHPQKIKPGSKMPNFIYGKDTVNALAHYMSQLK